MIKLFKKKTKLVTTFHCQDYYHQKWSWFARKFLMLGEWITCTIPDETIVVSELLKKYVEKKYDRKTTYVPNGAVVNINMNVNEIDKWGLKAQEYILSVGRLIRHKNIHQLIQAFIKLKKDRLILDKYKLVIVGDGFHTKGYVTELKKIAKNREDIIFTGTQSGKSIEQLFSQAKLFVQPSSDEGLSLVILEALGYRLPVLVSDIPENIEAIQGIGLTFKVNNLIDLTSKLQFALQDDDNNFDITYRERAKYLTDNLFNWSNITQKVLERYN
jgi:glycosyltransferase involved in cell wall biosynthesis